MKKILQDDLRTMKVFNEEEVEIGDTVIFYRVNQFFNGEVIDFTTKFVVIKALYPSGHTLTRRVRADNVIKRYTNEKGSHFNSGF